MHRPTKDPHTRPAIQTLERLHMELGEKKTSFGEMRETGVRSIEQGVRPALCPGPPSLRAGTHGHGRPG